MPRSVQLLLILESRKCLFVSAFVNRAAIRRSNFVACGGAFARNWCSDSSDSQIVVQVAKFGTCSVGVEFFSGDCVAVITDWRWSDSDDSSIDVGIVPTSTVFVELISRYLFPRISFL